MNTEVRSSRIETCVTWLYAAATLALVAWVVLTVARSAYSIASFALVIAGILFVLGFALTATPVVKRVWSHPVGKLAFTISNFVVLLIAGSLARTVLTSATGLPGQDFDWAVAMLSVLLYIPAAIAATSVILGTYAVAGQLWLYAQLITTGGGNQQVWRLACNVAGAFAALFFVLGAIQQYEKNRHLLNPLAIYFAYAGDYQPVRSYPGIAPGTLVVFHENGVVSMLNPEGDPRITITKLE